MCGAGYGRRVIDVPAIVQEKARVEGVADWIGTAAMAQVSPGGLRPPGGVSAETSPR